jgi:hypothetical protein
MTKLTNPFKADIPKAIETILYIATHAPIPDIYHICKIVYFADKLHLEEYGRQIFGDRYIAMKDGPVPNLAYDLLKDVRDKRDFVKAYDSLITAFTLKSNTVLPLRKPDLRLLSESDIQCLDQSIKDNGKLVFKALKDKSHDAAYNKADFNSDISLEDIIDTLPSGKQLKQYLAENVF